MMSSNDIIHIRNASLMDWAVYLTLSIFIGTGFIALPNTTERATVLILLFVFGLAHRFGYRVTTIERHVHVYMAIQALITAILFLRFPAADVFSFLLFLLVIQVTTALPPKLAARWVI